MKRIAAIASTLALVLVAGPALAQTKAPDPVDAKFVAADVDKSGHIDGKELDAYKANMAKIDSDKDGKISRKEFEIALMTGLVK